MPFAKFEPDSDEEGFINKIKDNYFDDTARLVFADFLEERGDPRGPYMRAQVEIAKLEREELERRKKSQRPSAEYFGSIAKLTHEMSALHYEHGGQWFGPLWSSASNERAGHGFIRGMMRIFGSPASFNFPSTQKALAWADSVQVYHEAGGMKELEKLFDRNQICCLAFSSWTAMMDGMRLRFARWLHRKSRKLPSRIVAIELGHGVTQEVFDLIATLPDHVLEQLKYIQAGPEWNQRAIGDACADLLQIREWAGRINVQP